MDPSELRNRVWRRVWKTPSVLLPASLAAPLLLGTLIPGAGPLIAFAGLCAGLASLGMLGTRALTAIDRLTAEEVAKIAHEHAQRRHLLLDRLDARLQTDRDPRPEALLRDLRVMMGQFEKDKPAADAMVTRQIVEVASKSARLFESCVRSLERTADLMDMAEKMATPAARQATLLRREKLIEEVGASVRHLGTIFDGVHSLGLARDDVQEMSRIRDELDRTLDAARRVEERMRELDVEIAGEASRTTERPPSARSAADR